jgi:hypothetical protein
MASSVEANIENAGTSASELLSQFRHLLKYENRNDLSNLDNLVAFGNWYAEQSVYDKAEALYLYALYGYDKTTVPGSAPILPILDIKKNLAILYTR